MEEDNKGGENYFGGPRSLFNVTKGDILIFRNFAIPVLHEPLFPGKGILIALVWVYKMVQSFKGRPDTRSKAGETAGICSSLVNFPRPKAQFRVVDADGVRDLLPALDLLS